MTSNPSPQPTQGQDTTAEEGVEAAFVAATEALDGMIESTLEAIGEVIGSVSA